MIMLIITAFYHGMLGMRVIIEDYVPNICIRSFLIVIIQLFCLTTVVAAIVALLSMISI